MSSDCRQHTIEFAALSTYLLKTIYQTMEQTLADGNVPLTPVQFSLLRHIAHEAQTIADLSRRLHLDPSTLVPMVDVLEEKGFIRRGQDPDDRRRIPLSATQAGQSLLDQHNLIATETALCAAFAKLGDEQSQALLTHLRTLVANLPDGDEALENVAWRMRVFLD